MKINIIKPLFFVIALAALSGCSPDSVVVSNNLSIDADSFKVNRRVVFYNGITNDYILTIEGLCSIKPGTNLPKEISVICKTGPDQYKKHYLGVSDNVTYFAEQIDSVPSNPYHYKVVFKPSSIIPDIQVQ